MPTINNPATTTAQKASQKASSSDRPSNREVENENQKSPSREGEPPRPATEPHGAADSTRSPKTQTDPGSGEG